MDPHVHSVVSGDGQTDVGVISQAAKARGYDSMFITDHQAGSNFPISTVVANNVTFEDDLGTKWEPDTSGTVTNPVATLASSPVRSGTKSLRLAAGSATSGESFVALKRGPNLRSGDLILKFSVYPTSIPAGSGLYVSASLGGDATVDKPVEGYTTRDAVVSPGKSTVMVWQLGKARAPSSDPNARVSVHDLPYQLNTWNDYEINVTTGVTKRNGSAIDIASAGLADIPAADRAQDYNALTQLKMAAGASGGGTAAGYFDAYHLDASSPVPSGQEFVHRNTIIGAYDTSTFTAFPSIEMGFNRHAQRFNFGITSGAEYNAFFGCDPSGASCAMTRGIDGIRPTQETGYPAQLNHPNVPGGVKLDEIIADDYRAYGADAMEVRQDPGGVPTTTMIDIWDEMLKRGTEVVGTWSSDMHKVDSLDVPDRGVATFLRASSRGFDDLMRSLFEGRAYMARAGFGGRVVFNLDPGSAEPYPSRYPVHLSAATTNVPVHLSVTGGIPTGARVVWLVNGTEFANEAPAGSSYEATKQIPVTGAALPYVRAELRLSTGWRLAMTEPILFRPVSGLPADMSYRMEGVTTAGGRGYTKLSTKGITSANWSVATQSLSLALENPVNALATVAVATATPPVAVKLDGNRITAASSSQEFDAATGSSWYYDPTSDLLRVKALQVDTGVSLLVERTDVTDTTPPTPPTGLTANVVAAGRVDLNWTASTDDVGVSSYQIYRDGSLLTTVTPRTTYSDTTAGTATTYRYVVRARDASGNLSAPSNEASATTPGSRLFLDGFETGDLSQWASASGLRVDQQHVRTGLFAARATGAGTPAYARTTLSAPQSDLYYRVRFKLISQAANTVNLLRLRTAGDASIIGLYVNSTGRLGWRNDVAAVGNTSTTVVTQGVWHEVQLHARISGPSGQTEVWYDGARVDSLSRTEALGTNAVGRLQLGENLAGATFDVAFDDIAADTAFIGDDLGPDTSPPQTTITLGPSGSVSDTTAIFTFTSSEAGSTFACSIDDALFGPCPFSYSGLAEGQHTFSVRATDAAGNTDPTPAQRTWTVDTVAPAAPSFTSPAEGSVLTSDTFTLTGAAEPGADVEILEGDVSLGSAAVDSAGRWTWTLTGASDGAHAYTAVARDAADNESPPSSPRSIVVDATSPDTTIGSGPSGSVSDSTATFSFSSNEPDSSFKCSLDDAAPSACLSPQTYSGLAEGSHRFSVQAVDSAGHADPTPATRSWTVDRTAPQTTIDSGPSGTASSRSASFAFSASESGSTFRCSLDGASPTACSSPKAYSGLTDGPHSFTVAATDGAGNADPTPAARSWTIDPTLFSDGFESGGFAAWTAVRTAGDGSATVQTTTVRSGGFAARLAASSSGGSFAYARHTLAAAETDLTASGDLQVSREGKAGAAVPLLTLLDSAGARLVSVERANVNGNRLQVRYGSSVQTTTGTLPLGTWATLDLHVVLRGGSTSTVEVRQDGALIHQESTAALGSAGARTLQIGNEQKKQTFTVFADNVSARR